MKRILAGLLLMASAVAVPFATVVGWFEPSFVLSFVSYASGLVGMALAAAGVTEVWLRRRNSG